MFKLFGALVLRSMDSKGPQSWFALNKRLLVWNLFLARVSLGGRHLTTWLGSTQMDKLVAASRMIPGVSETEVHRDRLLPSTLL